MGLFDTSCKLFCVNGGSGLELGSSVGITLFNFPGFSRFLEVPCRVSIWQNRVCKALRVVDAVRARRFGGLGVLGLNSGLWFGSYDQEWFDLGFRVCEKGLGSCGFSHVCNIGALGLEQGFGVYSIMITRRPPT